MSEEKVEQRPETSKCSRLEKRRMVSQNSTRSRIPIQSRTTQNFNLNSYNGMTLEEYFRQRLQGETPHQQDKKKKFLVTSNDFFKEFQPQQHQDLMRKTYMGENKYSNLQNETKQKLQSYDKDLFTKYGEKFGLNIAFGK